LAKLSNGNQSHIEEKKMFKKTNRILDRQARIRRIRAKVSGTTARPRLVVHRSLAHISAQVIDDTTHKTIVGLTDKGLTGKPTEKALALGKKIAELAKEKKITSVVFDRAGYNYHGRVAALAQGAREGGLEF
jgi:large subunit ribosomal protein L18